MKYLLIAAAIVGATLFAGASQANAGTVGQMLVRGCPNGQSIPALSTAIHQADALGYGTVQLHAQRADIYDNCRFKALNEYVRDEAAIGFLYDSYISMTPDNKKQRTQDLLTEAWDLSVQSHFADVRHDARVFFNLANPANPLPQVVTPKPQPQPVACQSVWVNDNTGVYHYPGQRWYGNTANGHYACEQDAINEGDRPTRNGQ